MPLSAYVLAVWGTAAATLSALAVVAGVSLFGYPARTLGVFLLLALVPTLCGHGLVNRALRELPAPTVGLFMLGEPVGAAALAFLFFGEVPSVATGVGGGLVLGALAWLVRGGRA
jgi:drug/metabolite transporter (DMT)-like permease